MVRLLTFYHTCYSIAIISHEFSALSVPQPSSRSYSHVSSRISSFMVIRITEVGLNPTLRFEASGRSSRSDLSRTPCGNQEAGNQAHVTTPDPRSLNFRSFSPWTRYFGYLIHRANLCMGYLQSEVFKNSSSENHLPFAITSECYFDH